MTPDDATSPGPAGDPTAAPRHRHRHPDAAVPDADPVVARLRSALDELTAGAEAGGPGAEAGRAPVAAVAARPARRWLVPAVAAAAVVAVVGVAVSLAGGRGDGTPASPIPTGPPVPTQPAPGTATIPWYELRLDEAIASAPVDTPLTGYEPQVWAATDYSRVLVAAATEDPAAGAEPDDWPVVEALTDVPIGTAWAIAGDAGPDAWHGVYWAPDDHTAVMLTGHGFSPPELAALLPALQIEPGPTVVSSMSSLVPLPTGPDTSLFAGRYPLGGQVDGTDSAAVLLAPGGSGRPLALWVAGARSLVPVSTRFGEGFRMELVDGTQGQTVVWWQVDGGPEWAGFSAPTERFDELFALVERVADIPRPAPNAPPPVPAAPCVVAMPPVTYAGDVQPTTTATVAVPCPPGPTTTSIPVVAQPTTTPVPPSTAGAPTVVGTTAPAGPVGPEPAMTAAVPSTLASGWRPPIAVGDSVMLSAVSSLGEAGIEVHAEEAAQASDIADQLETLRQTDRFGDAVIVHTGTNGTMTPADLDRMMAAAADVPRVVVLTAHAEAPWIAPNNELIRALPDRYPNVTVLDWDAIATTDPDLLAADGVHVADRAAYAAAISAAAGLT